MGDAKPIPVELLERIIDSPFLGGKNAGLLPPLGAIHDFNAKYEIHEAGEWTGYTIADLAAYALALREAVEGLLNTDIGRDEHEPLMDLPRFWVTEARALLGEDDARTP